jgi:alpha 1,2-mannosyltransferase
MLQISLHYILSFSNEGYGRATSITNIKNVIGKGPNPPYKIPLSDEYYSHPNVTFVHGRKANATIVMLARNNDLSGIIVSMKQLEDRFNKKYQYPYVFLNEQPFSDEFKT